MYDFFRYKSHARGKTKGDRLVNEQKQLLERLLKTAPNSYSVRVNDKDVQAIIQDVYFNDALITEKHMIVPYGTDINVGDYVHWDGVPYITLVKEDESVRSKQGVKIQACDNTLIWKAGESVLSVPVYTEDKTSPFSDGLNKTGGKFVRASDQISAIIQDNKITNSLELNQRFIFDHNKLKVFRLTRIKAMPSLGTLELILKRDGYNPYLDNLQLNLADYYEPEEHIVLPYIFGVDSISKLDDFEVFTLRNHETKNTIEWKVDNKNVAIKSVGQFDVEVCVKNKDIFDTYTLKAYDNDKLIAEKDFSSTYM